MGINDWCILDAMRPRANTNVGFQRISRRATQRGCAPGRSRSAGACPPDVDLATRDFTALDEVVADYIGRFREAARAEQRHFGTQPTIGDAVTKAAMALGEGNHKLRHQWRIKNRVLDRFAHRLLERKDSIRRALTFDALYGIVDDVAPKGIGKLTVYDTAHRIGSFLRLEPERVYLHAGTAAGARAMGFVRRDSVGVAELPSAFARLTPAEVEDCLCIYTDALTSLAPAM
jgi:hypothetical protein